MTHCLLLHFALVCKCIRFSYDYLLWNIMAAREYVWPRPMWNKNSDSGNYITPLSGWGLFLVQKHFGGCLWWSASVEYMACNILLDDFSRQSRLQQKPSQVKKDNAQFRHLSTALIHKSINYFTQCNYRTWFEDQYIYINTQTCQSCERCRFFFAQKTRHR